jgi:hypothetical protein
LAEKIRKTLTGRIMSVAEKENHVKGAIKKPVYCYDAKTKKLFMTFPGQGIMTRACNLKSNTSILRKLDHKIFRGKINGKNCELLLYSFPLL